MQAEPLTIRTPSAADTATIAELSGQLEYPASEQEAQARMDALAADDQIVLVAELGGNVAGIATAHVAPVLVFDEPICRVDVLVVADRARRRGVGRALMAAVEDEARRRGCGLVALESAVRRVEAHEFYRAIGYEDSALAFEKHL